MQITFISNYEKGVYFFSTDHSQDHGLGDDFIPCSRCFPFYVVPRESVPDGIVDTLEKFKSLYKELVEIPNPDPRYQPTFVNL